MADRVACPVRPLVERTGTVGGSGRPNAAHLAAGARVTRAPRFAETQRGASQAGRYGRARGLRSGARWWSV